MAAGSARAEAFTAGSDNFGVRASRVWQQGVCRVSNAGADSAGPARCAARVCRVEEAAASAGGVTECSTHTWQCHTAVCCAGEAVTARPRFDMSGANQCLPPNATQHEKQSTAAAHQAQAGVLTRRREPYMPHKLGTVLTYDVGTGGCAYLHALDMVAVVVYPQPLVKASPG